MPGGGLRSAPDRAETLPHAPQPAWDDLQDQAAVYSPARCTAGLTQRALIEQLVPVMARKRVQAGSGATPAPPQRLLAHRTSRHDVCGRGRSPRTTAALARWRPYTCGERLNQRWGAGRRRPSPTKSSRHRPTHEALQYLDVRSGGAPDVARQAGAAAALSSDRRLREQRSSQETSASPRTTSTP